MSKGKISNILTSILMGGMIGIGNAGLAKFLYDNGIWLDAYITGTQTIEELMFIIIIIWLIVGLIIGSTRR